MSLRAVLVIAIATHAAGVVAGHPTHIIAFGDSNTAVRGKVNVYANQLRKRLHNVRVTNAGVGGNHTGMALSRLDRDVLSQEPDIVIIMFGINDAAVDVWKTPPASKPRVSLDTYKSNLRRIVAKCRQGGATPILMTPTPLRWSEKTLQLYGRPPYNPDEADGFSVLLPSYVEAVREIAKQENVRFFDAWVAFNKAQGGPETLLLPDGMHLNDAGHALVTESLLLQIRSVRGTHAMPE